MPTLEARRSERIAFRAPVELLTQTDGGSLAHRVLARALDLGAGGMQLRAPVQMRVGERVRCRVELAGQPATLPGRVAWLHKSSSSRRGDGHGMGIRFEQLGDEEAALLRHVVERAHEASRPVTLHFPGATEPVEARGRMIGGGLRLLAELPIFTRGGEVGVELAPGAPPRRARIGDASLRDDDGKMRLEVDLTWLGGEADIAAPSGNDPTALRAARDRQSAPGERAGTGRGSFVLSWLVAALTGAGLALVVERGLVTQDGGLAFRARPADESSLPDFARPTPATAATGPAPQLETAPSGLDLAVAPAEPDPRSEVSIAPTERSKSLPSATPREPEPQAGSATATESSAVPARANDDSRPAKPPTPARGDTAAAASAERTDTATLVAPVASAQDPRTAAAVPSVTTDGDVVDVTFPFEGDLEDVFARVWATPHALAVDLPHGRTPLPLGRYPLEARDVVELQLNGRQGALLARVKVRNEVAHYEVRQSGDQLSLRLVFAKPGPRIETAP